MSDPRQQIRAEVKCPTCGEDEIMLAPFGETIRAYCTNPPCEFEQSFTYEVDLKNLAHLFAEPEEIQRLRQVIARQNRVLEMVYAHAKGLSIEQLGHIDNALNYKDEAEPPK